MMPLRGNGICQTDQKESQTEGAVLQLPSFAAVGSGSVSLGFDPENTILVNSHDRISDAVLVAILIRRLAAAFPAEVVI